MPPKGQGNVIYFVESIIVEEYQTSRNYKIYFPVPQYLNGHEGDEVRKAALILCVCFVLCATAKEKTISGKVTYIAAGSVYTSLGREQRVIDSSRVIVFQGKDTLAVLQVFALSSKSSVCRIIESREQFRVGDSVETVLQTPPSEKALPLMEQDTSIFVIKEIKPSKLLPVVSQETPSFLKVKGRVSMQYNTMSFDYSPQNIQQSGLVINLHGETTRMPLKFEMYGNLRTTARGNTGLFASSSKNDSRIYRMSLEYDDQTNILSLGRIFLFYVPSIGYIDGVSFARRFGNIITGASIGYQPSFNLQAPSNTYKKFLLFSQYQAKDTWNTTAGAAYARIWSSLGIEREVFSTSLNMYSPNGLFVYASSDIDLRTISQGISRTDPALSQLICSINYRFSNIVTAGIGADASRPVYSLLSTHSIPDSLLDKKLRSGISFNGGVYFWNGAGIYNTFTSRFSDNGFGKEYSNFSSIYFNNIIRTGIMIRMNYLLNENVLTRTQGYGVNIQRNILGIDCGIRYQQNHSDIRRFSLTNTTTTFGVDIGAMISRQITLIGSFDALQGLGSNSKSLFLELSWRF